MYYYIRVTLEDGQSFPYLARENVVQTFSHKPQAMDKAAEVKAFMQNCGIEGETEVRSWP
jgi:hypothetical protein